MKNLKLKNGDMYVIREARASDASRILKHTDIISRESDFLTFGTGEFIMSIEDEEKFLENTSERNNALYLIAEIEDTVIGILNFSAGTRPRTQHTGEFAVNVQKEYWGNGIGTELTTYMIDWCKQSNLIRKINLLVRNDNFSAINIYKKLEFIEEGLITRILKIDGKFYDGLYMGFYID